MSEIRLQLVSTGQQWRFQKDEVRIGRDATCDVTLSGNDYPSVSRHHALIRYDGSQWLLEDLNSTAGTYVNGSRTQRAQLFPGDIIHLAMDGPELRFDASAADPDRIPEAAHTPEAPGVGRVHAAAEAPPAGGTRVLAVPRAPRSGEAPTRMVQRAAAPPSPPRATAPPPRATAPPPRAGSSPIRIGTPAQPPATVRPEVQPDGISPDEPGGTTAEPQSPAWPVIEQQQAAIVQKLKALHTLLLVAVVMIATLGCIVVLQARAIDQNRADLQSIKRDAVETLMPALDARLKKAETAMDGMDIKMQRSEDRFVQRMDREVPRILEQYLKQKITEVQTNVAKPAKRGR